MRRLALIISLLAAAASAALVIGASAQGSSTYTFDVIFDDARGLVGGQLVKIAGAQAGTISSVTVTPDYKARIQATVNDAFRFHTDATCSIRPQGLIAENYVECDPGSSTAPLLRATGGHPPTVPVTQTTEPVSLTDLFNIFNLPTGERLQVLTDELGIATAARGADLNAILRRANPALTLARQVISILQRQRAQLTTIIDATGQIAAEGAAHTQAVQDFISRASQLAALTADHAGALNESIDRLPGLLDAAQPALTQLDTVAREGTPLLTSVRTAVPYLNRVDADIGPFTKVAQPALSKVNTAITAAIPAIRAATPLVDSIAAYVKRSQASTLLFSRLSVNLQAHGFVENFLSILYYVTASLARYDSTSHMLAILLVGPDNGQCGQYATTPVAACSAHYGSQPAYKPARKDAPAAARRSSAAAVRPRRGTNTHQVAASSPPSLSSLTGGVPASSVQQTGQTLQSLVNYLLR